MLLFYRSVIYRIFKRDFIIILFFLKENVDSALEFPDVLINVEKFLESHQLGTNYKFAIATDGPW